MQQRTDLVRTDDISHHAVQTLCDVTSGPLLIVRKLSTAVRVPEIRGEMKLVCSIIMPAVFWTTMQCFLHIHSTNEKPSYFLPLNCL